MPRATASFVWDLVKFVWRAAVAGAAVIGFLIVIEMPIRGNTVLFFWGLGAVLLGMRGLLEGARRRVALRRQARRSVRWESPDGAALVQPQHSQA